MACYNSTPLDSEFKQMNLGQTTTIEEVYWGSDGEDIVTTVTIEAPQPIVNNRGRRGNNGRGNNYNRGNGNGYNRGNGNGYNRGNGNGYNRGNGNGYNRGNGNGYNRGDGNDYNRGHRNDYNRDSSRQSNRRDDDGDGWSCQNVQRNNQSSRSDSNNIEGAEDGWSFQNSRRRNNGNGYRNSNTRQYAENTNNYSHRESAREVEEEKEAPITMAEMKRRMDEYEQAELASLPPIVKKLYFEHPEVTALTPGKVIQIRKTNFDITVSNITKEGKEPNTGVIPNPVLKFEHAFEKYPEVLDVVTSKDFKEPTPIQKQGWPILMSGRDMIGIAQTGTGKTLAFLLPGLIHIMAQTTPLENRLGPSMLVLAPTRELAQQIHSEILKFKVEGIRSVCIYGQGDTHAQRQALEDGVEIIVATPGRLIDFYKRGVTTLKHVTFFILDEADRMLDLGFQPDIMKMHYAIRSDRQVAMTSATWLSDIQYVANRLMNDPVMVRVGNMDLAAVHTVTQNIIVCEEKDKVALFEEYANELKPDDKVIMFANRKAVVGWLGLKLIDFKIYDYDTMSGDVPQESREKALEGFKNGEIRILIATDVASRGLDVKGVTKVLNYDVPKNMEEYVHRCGRTGRAEKTGEVLSFVCWDDRSRVKELIEILERGNNEIPQELRRMAERFERQKAARKSGRGNYGRGRSRY